MKCAFPPYRLHYHNILFNHTRPVAYGGEREDGHPLLGTKSPHALLAVVLVHLVRARKARGRGFNLPAQPRTRGSRPIWFLRVARVEVDLKSINRRNTRSHGSTCRYTERYERSREVHARRFNWSCISVAQSVLPRVRTIIMDLIPLR